MRTIVLNPSCTDLGLPEVRVGRASAFYALVRGVPAAFDNVQIHFCRPGGTAPSVATGVRVPGNDVRVYASPLHFPDEGRTRYHITARDAEGASVWLGSGTLQIEPSVLNADGQDAPLVPEDTCIRNPKTGLYHKLLAEANEDGEITLSLEQEGITK